MLQIVIRSSIDMRSTTGPGVLVGVARAAFDAEPADDLEDHVLRVDAGQQPARHVDAADLQRLQRQALRREHVAHLRGADAERDRAERAVRGGVAVAAGDRHARLREPELRPDDVDDALVRAADVVERDAVLAAVPLERRQHLLGHRVEERPLAIGRRDDVVDRGERAVREGARASRAAASMSNACGLVTSWTRCRPMNSCVCPVGSAAHGVRVPHLLQECLTHNDQLITALNYSPRLRNANAGVYLSRLCRSELPVLVRSSISRVPLKPASPARRQSCRRAWRWSA